MGCDIHAHIEIKILDKWEHYSSPRIQRCYSLFSYMAGVRNSPNSLTPLSPPKGLPANLSLITKICWTHEHEDSHSPSWLSVVELKKAINFHNKIVHMCEHTEWGYLCGNGLGDFRPNNSPMYPNEIEDVRLVFWFDN